MGNNTALRLHPSQDEGDILAGTVVEDMVCDALIGRDGATHYVPNYCHDFTAAALGLNNVDDAVAAGWAYVTISSSRTIIAPRVNDAQEQALWNMYGVAVASTTTRCRDFVLAFDTWQAAERNR